MEAAIAINDIIKTTQSIGKGDATDNEIIIITTIQKCLNLPLKNVRRERLPE